MLQRSSIFLVLLGVAIGLFCGQAQAQTQAKDPVRLVFAADLAPLSFEEQGVKQGILIDVAREILERRLGQPVDVGLYPWERAQQMVMRGEADGFVTIATKARAVYANCGRIPVLRTPLHPLVRAENPRRREIELATSLAELKPFEIVSYRGNGWAKQYLEGFDVFFATDFQSSLRGLAAGRGDLAFVTTTAGPYYLREFGFEQELVILPLVVDVFSYVLCIRKDSPHSVMLPEFDRVLEVMRAEGAYAPILERYGLTPDAYY